MSSPSCLGNSSPPVYGGIIQYYLECLNLLMEFSSRRESAAQPANALTDDPITVTINLSHSFSTSPKTSPKTNPGTNSKTSSHKKNKNKPQNKTNPIFQHQLLAHCGPEPPAAVLKKGCGCNQDLRGPGVQQYKLFQSSCRTEYVCEWTDSMVTSV